MCTQLSLYVLKTASLNANNNALLSIRKTTISIYKQLIDIAYYFMKYLYSFCNTLLFLNINTNNIQIRKFCNLKRTITFFTITFLNEIYVHLLFRMYDTISVKRLQKKNSTVVNELGCKLDNGMVDNVS